MEHFSEKEFRCNCGKCGMGQSDMDEDILFDLNWIRERYGKPIYITSAIRCPTWNKKQSKATNHCTGKAIDIYGRNMFELLSIIFAGIHEDKLSINGIGISSHFIHIDNNHNIQTFWTY